MSPTQYLLRLLGFVGAAALLPPLLGAFALYYFNLVAFSSVVEVMGSLPFQVVAFTIPLFYLGYFYYFFARPTLPLLQRTLSREENYAIYCRLRRFPLDFWLLVLFSSLLRAKLFIYLAQQIDPLAMSLVVQQQIFTLATIVTLIVGMPIFFLMTDFFGYLAPYLTYTRPILSIRVKGLILGCLMPLLLLLVFQLYYYTHTGYLTTETVALAGVLELLAIISSLLFSRSFNQSISPLRTVIHHPTHSFRESVQDLTPTSLDELGVLTHEYRRLMEFHHEAEQKLILSERELSSILDTISEFFFSIDSDERVNKITSAVERTLGYRVEELIGHPFSLLCEESSGFNQLIHSLQQNQGVIHDTTCKMRHKDGHILFVTLSARIVSHSRSRQVAIEGSARDMTNLVRTQEALQAEQRRAVITLEAINDGVLSLFKDGTIEYANEMARLLSGHTGSIIGHCFTDLFQMYSEAKKAPIHFDSILQHIIQSCDNDQIRTTLSRHGQPVLTIDISVGVIYDSDANIRSVVLVLHDVTDTVSLAEELSFQAAHDQLTGLNNRREFEHRLNQALHDAQNKRVIHALLYIDLDQFKVVNDTCGHQAGDELLKQITAQLHPLVRSSDTLARLGGDEFGVILNNCPQDKAYQLADEIRATVRNFRFHWENKTFEIGASIGLVTMTDQTQNVHELMRAADSACYLAKDLGRNRIYVYKEDDESVLQKHGEMNWVHRITDAMNYNRLILYAQEIRALNTSAEDRPHYEILVRMLDDHGETIPPMAFIPAAERYNLMADIDRWIIRNAMQQLAAVLDDHGNPPIICSINLSGQSVSDERFLEFITTTMSQTAIPPQSLCFEITETSAITHLSKAMELFSALRAMGCTFSLDDFGSGLSSFGYLKNLPVDCLKIDGSFVRDILTDPIDRQMVDSINKIGHIMHLSTIAEFVENDESIALLREMEIDFVQGYGVAKPKPLHEVLAPYRR